MQIKHVIIKVDDQDKALAFYTQTLGFVKRIDIPGDIRWLTVSAADDPDGTELVLEPNHFPPAATSQRALYGAHFPAAILTTHAIDTEYKRLKRLGVEFLAEPKNIGRGEVRFLRRHLWQLDRSE